MGKNKNKNKKGNSFSSSNGSNGNGSSNKWNPIVNDISATNKVKVRRIEFHKASKPSTAFNTISISNSNNSNNSNSSNANNNHSKNGNSSSNDKNDKIGGSPTPGLFDPLTVSKYLKWIKVSRPGPGLYNHGNTCYLNSTLQCLLHTASLTQCMLNEEKSVLQGLNKFGDDRTITQLFQKLVKEAWSISPGKSISPRSMVQNIRRVGKQFKPMRQEDAHEYLRLLLDCMHEEILKAHGVSLKDGKIAETTIISRIFGGYLCNELKCSECSYSSKTFNHFQDLSVEVSHQKLKSVNDAINAFIKAEILSDGNEWKCDGCKKKVKARKQMTVYKAPNVLVLHLKRFSFGNMFGKITKNIEFGQDLYLPCSGEESSKVKYELSSMIVHHGSSVHGGHYVAFIKAPNGQWYEMNDSQVSATSINTVMKQQAYVLFYTRAVNDTTVKDTTLTTNNPIKSQEKEDTIPKKVEPKINPTERTSLVPPIVRLKPFTPTPFRWKGPLFKFFNQLYSPFKGLIRKVTGDKKKIKYNIKNAKTSSDDDSEGDDRDDSESDDRDDSKSDSDDDHKLNNSYNNSKINNNDDDDDDDDDDKNKYNKEKLKMLMRKTVGTADYWDTLPANKMNEIEAIARKQQKSEQQLLGSRQTSEWDKTLDKGRIKKIKDKPQEIEDDLPNPFQKVIETRKREDTYSDDKSRMKKRKR